MNRTALSRLICGAMIVAATLGAAGCSKKITRVDPSFIVPEGRYSPNARMILYPDIEALLPVYQDIAPIGPDPGDPLIGYAPFRATGPGVIHGMVVDGTSATRYQLLRRESSGGYMPLKDFIFGPSVRWLDSQWEVYQFQDQTPSSFSPATYLGRGLVAGAVTNTSPLTNAAQMTGNAVSHVRFSGDLFPPDSLFRLSWGPVRGAAGYWIQVFEYFGAPTEEIIFNGLPSPFAIGHVVNRYVAYVAAPDTGYKLGNPGAEVFVHQTIVTSGAYLVRIVAVDANGRLVGFSYGDDAVATRTAEYLVYPLGAFIVQPVRPKSVPARARALTVRPLSPSSPYFTRWVRAR